MRYLNRYPRDTSNLSLSNHAWNKAHHRDISAHEINRAFEKGEIIEDFTDTVLTNDPKRDQLIAYKLDLPIPLWVIYDPDTRLIVTQYYDDQKGAVQGSITNTSDFR
jgi:hypothetical protein